MKNKKKLTTLCIIPVKDMRRSKQRLSNILTKAQRKTLTHAMLFDVLQCVTKVKEIHKVALVTKDKNAQKLARYFGAKIIKEKKNKGHTHAVAYALNHSLVSQYNRVLLLPADIPTINKSELKKILQAQNTFPFILFVPARNKRGTNAILISPPDIFLPEYGDDSFKPHLRRAEESGISYKILKLASIALDVDNKKDFELLKKKCRKGKTNEWLKKEGCRGAACRGQEEKNR